MGKRTSVYLADDLAKAVEASGRSIADLLRAGLAAADPSPGRRQAECKHPGVGRKLRCPRCGRYNV